MIHEDFHLYLVRCYSFRVNDLLRLSEAAQLIRLLLRSTYLDGIPNSTIVFFLLNVLLRYSRDFRRGGSDGSSF